MNQRGISREAVLAALDWGRSWYSYGCEVFVLGRRDIVAARRHGLDLSGFEGTRVVEDDDTIVTTGHSRRGRYRPRVCNKRHRRNARNLKFAHGWS